MRETRTLVLIGDFNPKGRDINKIALICNSGGPLLLPLQTKMDIIYMLNRELLKSIIDYLYMVNSTEPERKKKCEEKVVQYKLVKNQSPEE